MTPMSGVSPGASNTSPPIQPRKYHGFIPDAGELVFGFFTLFVLRNDMRTEISRESVYANLSCVFRHLAPAIQRQHHQERKGAFQMCTLVGGNFLRDRIVVATYSALHGVAPSSVHAGPALDLTCGGEQHTIRRLPSTACP
jgi:hypothetical protein